MIYTRKEMKNELKRSCLGVLQEYLQEVGFNNEEAILFKERYINERSVPIICLIIHCGTNKFNYVHNRILDKCISYHNRIFRVDCE